MTGSLSVSQVLAAELGKMGNGISIDKDGEIAPAIETSRDEIQFPYKLRLEEKSFFDLPGEIRNVIYGIWFTRKAAVLSLRVSRGLVKSDTDIWTPMDPVLNWYLRWDRSSKPLPLEMSVLRVCELMNAEANATLFSGETTIDLRDPIGTSSVDRLYQYIQDPVCARPLQWARRIKLSLYPILGDESGRKEFAATSNALIEILDGGSRLKSLDIHLHVSDHPTKAQVKESIMLLKGFCVKGSLAIRHIIYGHEYENWIPGAWGYQLLNEMKGKQVYFYFV
jgi:hypothetical protein